MGRPRGRVALHSTQGFVMKHMSQADMNAMVHDGTVDEVEDATQPNGVRYQMRSYQKSRETSPTGITASDMKLNVGLGGDPTPLEKRRDGFIDPVEAAKEKIKAWPEIGEVRNQVKIPYTREIDFVVLRHHLGDGVFIQIEHEKVFSL